MENIRKIKERVLRRLEGVKNTEDILRENAIKLAKHHKKYCEGKLNGNCDISLALLRELLRGKYKIELTEGEEGEFI